MMKNKMYQNDNPETEREYENHYNGGPVGPVGAHQVSDVFREYIMDLIDDFDRMDERKIQRQNAIRELLDDMETQTARLSINIKKMREITNAK